MAEDIRISDKVEIRFPNFKKGNHISIDAFFVCTTRLEIGDYVHIAPHVSVIGGKEAWLTMGHFTNLAAGTRVICAGDSFSGAGLIGVGPAIPADYRDTVVKGNVIIEDMANVGSNAIIFPGVTLAQGSVIGAGCVIRKSTEPWTIYVGNPGRPIKTRPHEKMIEYAQKMGYPIEKK